MRTPTAAIVGIAILALAFLISALAFVLADAAGAFGAPHARVPLAVASDLVDWIVMLAAILAGMLAAYLVGDSEGYWRGRKSALDHVEPRRVPADYPEFLAGIDEAPARQSYAPAREASR